MEQAGKIQQVLPGHNEQTPRSMKDLKGLEWMAALTGWLRTFARHYPRAADNPWGPEDLEIYGRGLSELSLTDLNRKCEQVMKTCGSWAPTIGMILEAIPPDVEQPKIATECATCHGTGWRDVPGSRSVARCDHKATA